MSRISFTHCLYWKTTYFPSYHPGKVSNPLKISNRKGAANFGHSTLSWWPDFLLDWNGQIVCLFGIYVDSKGIKSYYAVLTHKCEDSHFRKHDFIFHLRSSVWEWVFSFEICGQTGVNLYNSNWDYSTCSWLILSHFRFYPYLSSVITL